MKLSPLSAFAALMLVSACSGNGAGAEAEHAEGEEGHAEGEDHGHGGGVVVTHYSDTAELFVEYPPLVTGEPSAFAAHLSWLADFRAVNEGQLVVELVRPNGVVQRAAAGVSDTPGIFRPEVTPRGAGPARLILRLNARNRTSLHDLGAVRVFATREEANRALPAAEELPGRIAFTKEIQWRIPFANAPATVRRLEAALPVTIDVRLAPEAEAVIASPVAGIVRTGSNVPAPGMAVRAGQTLATISAQLGGGEDVASLDLAIAQARINVDAARREVGRMSSLYRAEAVPQRRLQDAQTALRLAQAELGAATRRRSALGGGGPGVPLVAPISGRILTSSLVRGAAVEAGTELMRIGDPNRLWLVARVPESQAGGIISPTGIDLIRAGGVASFSNGRGVRLVQGTGFVDPRTRTMDVIFASSGIGLSPGQRLQGRLRTGLVRNALSVPASAIINEGGQNVVYVQVEGESFERRPVQIGLRSGGYVEIAGEVRPGERVVTVGAAAVRAAAAAPGTFGHGHAH